LRTKQIVNATRTVPNEEERNRQMLTEPLNGPDPSRSSQLEHPTRRIEAALDPQGAGEPPGPNADLAGMGEGIGQRPQARHLCT